MCEIKNNNKQREAWPGQIDPLTNVSGALWGSGSGRDDDIVKSSFFAQESAGVIPCPLVVAHHDRRRCGRTKEPLDLTRDMRSEDE